MPFGLNRSTDYCERNNPGRTAYYVAEGQTRIFIRSGEIATKPKSDTEKILKIAIIAPKVYPVFDQSVVDSYGGAEVALSLVARELSQINDFDVHVLVGDYGQADEERAGAVTLHRSLVSNANPLRSGLRLFSKMNSVDADIYIQRTLTIASTVIALYCRVRRRRFVYWVAHDSEADGGHPLYNSRLTSPLVKLMFKMASHVVVQNDYEYDQLLMQFPGISCSVVKKGMELPRDPTRMDEKYDAVWVGRCDKWKNPEAFVRLAKKHSSHRFLMICPPAEGKEDYHRELTASASNCGNLEIRGRTSNSKVLELVAECSVFCITSSQEGDWPNVVLEAASLRKPILSLDLNYHGLISDYAGGRFCGGDFLRFAAEFETMIEDEGLRSQLGDGAYDYVKDVHDVRKQTTKLVDLINELS